MNAQPPSPTTAPQPPAALLSDQLAVAVKQIRLAKTHLLPASPDAEGAAFPLLFQLACGPLRVSDLAEAVHSDTSTVSRQVSSLTERGLLVKTEHPGDRRAYQVSLTDHGRRVIEERIEQRRALFADVLQHWSADDVADFTRLLERFCADLDAWASTHPRR